MYFKPRYQFGIGIPNEDANGTVAKFTLRDISVGVPIRTCTDDELENIPAYEIISPLLWDPSRKVHAEYEMATQQGDNISRYQRVNIDMGEQSKRATRRVNILYMWEDSTEEILLPMLRHSDIFS